MYTFPYNYTKLHTHSQMQQLLMLELCAFSLLSVLAGEKSQDTDKKQGCSRAVL